MDAWRMVHPGGDGPEPCPPEYEPVNEADGDEPDGWWDEWPADNPTTDEWCDACLGEGDDDTTD